MSILTWTSVAILSFVLFDTYIRQDQITKTFSSKLIYGIGSIALGIWIATFSVEIRKALGIAFAVFLFGFGFRVIRMAFNQYSKNQKIKKKQKKLNALKQVKTLRRQKYIQNRRVIPKRHHINQNPSR